MKRITLFLGCVVVLALTSCRKDWSCKCTDNNSNTTFYAVPDASFNDADNTCNDNEYHAGPSYKNCSLVP